MRSSDLMIITRFTDCAPPGTWYGAALVLAAKRLRANLDSIEIDEEANGRIRQ
jgi:hypothetical protein